MGPQLPVLGICQPKPCWRKHTKIGVCCASTVLDEKFFLGGVGAPYFGARLVFNYIIWANAPCCQKISQKMMPHQFSASWKHAKFRHMIPGRRKLVPVHFFWNLFASRGMCPNSLYAYIRGPKISGAKSNNCPQNIRNKVGADVLI